MNSSEVSNSSRSAETRSSTSASTVASSAVVGSSRISSAGSDGERHRDHHPLEHAARELVRIAIHHAGGIGDPHLLEHLLGALERLLALRVPSISNTSATWRPTRIDGLSARPGSW